MKWLAVLGMLCGLAAFGPARAQVQVSAQMSRSQFLLYERVDLLVDILNNTGSDITLDNEPGHPWLSFLVTKQNHLPVRAERGAQFRPLTLKAGQSRQLRINLTPLFSFREVGSYSAAAVIDLSGTGDIVSDNVPFSVTEGREVWKRERPVDGSTRTYSLIRFSPQPDQTNLYLRVEDASVNAVYANLSLGEVSAYVEPDVFFDPAGNLHVLQLSSMNTYLYSRADEDGKILHQGVFITYRQIRPRLEKLEDGNVTVVGGLERNLSAPHETLSQGQGGHPSSAPASGADVGVPPSGPSEPPIALPVPPSTAVVAPAPVAAPAEGVPPIGPSAEAGTSAR
jgi:hypothetical protein